jgi:RNA polymerase sigma-70 factor (ECF subfamily)
LVRRGLLDDVGAELKMDERDWLASRFEEHRSHLGAVAYRMLGSVTEAEDALQDAWVRACPADTSGIENMREWLTTVVARVCLNMLRSRRARAEEHSVHLPDPVVSLQENAGPEHEALLADSVGLALLVVLDTLAPAERLAFVLHDMFAMPFEEIAALLDRSPAAARQLASRARRRVQGSPTPDTDLVRQREVVQAFFAASRDGDFDALLAVLDPDVELRIDGGTRREDSSLLLRGADAVAAHTATYSRLYRFVQPALVNGAPGAVVAPHGRLFSVMAFTLSSGRITAIDALVDPERLARLHPAAPPR